MKTLVTGATGIVGNSIARALVESGRPVRALVRSIDKARKLLPGAVELVQGDITDAASVANAIEGCAIVHHSAGLPEQWLRDDRDFDRINIGGTENVVAALGSAKLVYTSTIDVFKAEVGAEFDESEVDPVPKTTAYERSKQEADRRVVAAVAKGAHAVFIHPSALYGPAPAGSPGLNDFILRIRDKKVPMLVPGGMPIVYAPDVARGHVLAESAASGSRYILSEKFYSMKELAELVSRAFGIQSVPGVMPLGMAKVVSGAGGILSSLTKSAPLLPKGQLIFLQWGAKPKSDRAQRELGWKPTPFAEGLQKTIEYLGRINAS